MKNSIDTDHTYFQVCGIGQDEKSAAIEFLKEFDKQIKFNSAIYELIIRTPFEYQSSFDFQQLNLHKFYMRGSYRLIANQDVSFKNEVSFAGFKS